MCLFRKFHLQGSRDPKTRSLLVVNEQFSDKCKATNGTLWTDTNYAESGEAMKSFIAEKRLKKIISLIKPGDYLFIQFGHNDQKTYSGAYLEAHTGYREYLKS